MGSQRTQTPTDTRIMQTLEYASAQQDLSRSLLRLTWILQQCTSIPIPTLPSSVKTHTFELVHQASKRRTPKQPSSSSSHPPRFSITCVKPTSGIIASYLAYLDAWIEGWKRRGWLIGLLILVRGIILPLPLFSEFHDLPFLVLNCAFHWTVVGDHVRNLREDILIHRLNYSLTTVDTDEGQREEFLDKAVQALEK
jgi:hypothetical protein